MSTYYVTQPWSDGPGGNTPVTAATLTHVETGLGSAHDRIDALAVGSVLIPTAIRTTATPPTAGQLVTYDASGGNIGPIALPVPTAGVIMSVVKGDATTNTITFTSSLLLGNASTSIVLRTVGESRALYGSASGWFVSGLHAPIVGTTAGTVAAGDDARFANTLTASLYGGPTRTYAPVCNVAFTGGTFPVTNNDLYARGGWSALQDPESLLGTVGAYAVINVPVTGRYVYHYHVASMTSSGGTTANCRISKNSPSTAATIVSDLRATVTNSVHILDAAGEGVLSAGDQLYWANYCGYGTQTVYGSGSPVLDVTHITVRYIGPN